MRHSPSTPMTERKVQDAAPTAVIRRSVLLGRSRQPARGR